MKGATFSTSQCQRQQTIDRTNAGQERVKPTRCEGEESRVNVKCTYFFTKGLTKNNVKVELILNMVNTHISVMPSGMLAGIAVRPFPLQSTILFVQAHIGGQEPDARPQG